MALNPTAGQPKYSPLETPVRRAENAFAQSRTTLNPQPALQGDSVHFKGKEELNSGKSTKVDGETTGKRATAPKSAQSASKAKPGANPTPKGSAKAESAEAQGKTPPKYGYFQNNAREAARILLCDVTPLLLSVPMLGGVPGFLLSLACMPAAYVAGKTGRWIAKDVDKENLTPVFKYVSTVRNALFSNELSGKDGQRDEVVDLINKATDNFLDIRSGGSFIKPWLMGFLKLEKEKGLGRMLTKFSVLRAEVNTRIAQSENVGEAGKAAVKGGLNYAFYSVLSTIGRSLSAVGGKSPLFAPIRWIGTMLKHAAWLKIAASVVLGGGTTNPKASTAA